jgi:hypothetical protein
VTNNKKGVVSRNRMRTMNKIVHVNEAVIWNTSKSVTTVGYIASIKRILTKDLEMFLCKIQMHHNLSECAEDVTVDFCGPFLQFFSRKSCSFSKHLV